MSQGGGANYEQCVYQQQPGNRANHALKQIHKEPECFSLYARMIMGAFLQRWYSAEIGLARQQRLLLQVLETSTFSN